MFPLYEEIKHFMLENVNINTEITVEAGAGPSFTSNITVRGSCAAKFLSDMKNSKMFGLASPGDNGLDDDDDDAHARVRDNSKDISRFSSALPDRKKKCSDASGKKNDSKVEKCRDQKGQRRRNTMSSFIEMAKNQLAASNALNRKCPVLQSAREIYENKRHCTYQILVKSSCFGPLRKHLGMWTTPKMTNCFVGWQLN